MMDIYMSKANERLTLEELKDIGAGHHTWVRIYNRGVFPGTDTQFGTDYIAAAVTDEVDGTGLVAVWCAGGEDDLLIEADYGTKWIAYLKRPYEG